MVQSLGNSQAQAIMNLCVNAVDALPDRGTLPHLRRLLPGVPILLVTGRPDQTALELVAAHPGVMLLPKPFGIEELQAYLVLLGRRENAPSTPTRRFGQT
ncbi:MAG: hypothetical protein HGB30_11620 [Holophagaceae bacterium]|nr:hypothetical protein [Holophagaceae bacterium]